MVGTDIYEIFTGALRGWFGDACLNTAVYEVAGPLLLIAEYARFNRALVTISKSVQLRSVSAPRRRA